MTSGSTRRGADRRDAIFAAALRLFRERGFHATGINEIGAAAGVTGPAIYRHFESKGQVLAEAIREGSRRIAAALREAAAADADPETALEALIRAYVRVALENADLNAAYMLESRHLEPELRAPLRRSEGRLRERLCEALLAVHPELPRERARTRVQMAIFAIASLCIVPSRLEHEELVATATEQVMAGLLAA